MKQEIKDKWVGALRSGEYQQGKGALQRDGKFCCLGILSDLYAKENNVEWKDYRDGSDYKCFLGSMGILPFQVVQWAGLESVNPCVSSIHRSEPISRINDRGVSFTEIADLIEKNF